LEDVRGDRKILVRWQACACGRHRALDEFEKLARLARTPRSHEVRTGERRSFVVPSQIGHVTAGAARRIRLLARRRLRSSERRTDRRSWLLGGDDNDREYGSYEACERASCRFCAVDAP
jgi:hypothetical protein